MKKLSADAIIVGNGEVIRDHVVVIEESVVKAIEPLSNFDPSEVDIRKGILTPGFVNAHCHLELSHMKGIIPSGTGLIKFIKGVISQRDFEEEVILDAIGMADEEMQSNGIVAVGDISNMTHTIATKTQSPIKYYNFIECFDLLQEQLAPGNFNNYREVYSKFRENGLDRSALVPHAPYSVSKQLFQMIREFNSEASVTVSIHNQETEGEDLLFKNKTGDLIDFFDFVGIDLGGFKATGETSIRYALPEMDAGQRTILVHNTMCGSEDVQFAQKWSPDVYFCTCPNANLYIENRLPDYKLLKESGSKICIGTDSLSSNWRLSILDEMRAILKYNSFIALDEVIQWATLNGAEALGLQNELGSIEVGKAPGINLIQADLSRNDLEEATDVEKII